MRNQVELIAADVHTQVGSVTLFGEFESEANCLLTTSYQMISHFRALIFAVDRQFSGTICRVIYTRETNLVAHDDEGTNGRSDLDDDLS